DERGIGANKGAIADVGRMLFGAIVVTGDRASADIRIFTHFAVAEVTEVTDLGTTADAGFFDFDKIADKAAILHPGAGAETSERSDDTMLTKARVFKNRMCANLGMTAHG